MASSPFLQHRGPGGELKPKLWQANGEIIAGIRAAGSVLIFGPGEAKTELKRRIERNTSDGRTIEMETSDRMTEHQIVQKVRTHFDATMGLSLRTGTRRLRGNDCEV